MLYNEKKKSDEFDPKIHLHYGALIFLKPGTQFTGNQKILYSNGFIQNDLKFLDEKSPDLDADLYGSIFQIVPCYNL
jgi:hypothetical protein